MASPPPVLLSIAGHDPSSGAGITADLETFAAHGMFGVSAITALTVQSTQGVAGVHPVPPALLAQVLDHLAADLPLAGIKIGMLGSAGAVHAVSGFLGGLGSVSGRGGMGGMGAPQPPAVLDPILRSSSGAALLDPDALDTLHRELLPRVAWITPNWSELAVLAGVLVRNTVEAETASHALGARHPQLSIVATAGDRDVPVDLLRLPSGAMQRFSGEHIATTSTHGTGCAFSSALLANLVLGLAPGEAVATAKLYVAEALRRAPGLGNGRGPLNLLWPLLTS